MKNKNHDEELQSRREFFKKAAKGTLPILGAILLANIPDILKAGEISMNCNYGCAGACYNSCVGTCDKLCSGVCWDNCNGNCKDGCKSSCMQSCYGSSY